MGSEENQEISPEELIKKEAEAIFAKTYHCPICDEDFKHKTVKSNRVRRLGADIDLRPRMKDVDILKYQMLFCPHCGYAAMPAYFDHISGTQRRLITANISETFEPKEESESPVISYDEAIGAYLQALKCAEVKLGKLSEKAYYNLIVHWLMEEKLLEIKNEDTKAKLATQSELFYRRAYDGFTKAISEEYFPMAGMDEITVDYLVGYMAYHFKDFEIASKQVSTVLVNQMAPRRIKDLALELKEKIIEELKKK